jgi:hypothetical protein
MERNALRLQLADCHRYLTILEWRIFFSGLRNRSQEWFEGERDSVCIQSPLMQINANAVCLVRTQFQQIRIGLGR